MFIDNKVAIVEAAELMGDFERWAIKKYEIGGCWNDTETR